MSLMGLVLRPHFQGIVFFDKIWRELDSPLLTPTNQAQSTLYSSWKVKPSFPIHRGIGSTHAPRTSFGFMELLSSMLPLLPVPPSTSGRSRRRRDSGTCWSLNLSLMMTTTTIPTTTVLSGTIAFLLTLRCLSQIITYNNQMDEGHGRGMRMQDEDEEDEDEDGEEDDDDVDGQGRG